MIYFFIYLLISICLFIALWQEELKIQTYFRNLKEVYFIKRSILVFILSLGGLPPILGFVSKLFVIFRVAGSII